MRQSTLFVKTRKEAPKDEVAKNAKLLIRAGFIHKEMAGVYSFLPFGLRVMNKISDVIREEMNNAGGEELSMSHLQDKSVWEKTNRWDEKVVDNWFKTRLVGGGEAGLGFTHEEPITNLMRNHINSFRDLPVFLYQIQTKFRNEERAKSGIIRGREFLMKDLYSFCKDENEQSGFYEKMKKIYEKIFDRVGLGEETYITYASGGSFSKYSHEFQALSEAGEDTIHICEKCHSAINDEIFGEQKMCPSCQNRDLKKEKSIEVGNIFNLGTRFSEALGLYYKDEKGEKKLVFMGSYGIGVGRLMGAVAEIKSDERGLVWNEEIAPFKAHLVLINPKGDKPLSDFGEDIYKTLTKMKVETLFDDRDVSAGEKLGDADLIGIPNRLIISEKTFKEGKIEFKRRSEKDSSLKSLEEIQKIFS